MKFNKLPKHSILVIAIITTWIKTYITYQSSFDMEIDNSMQQFILLINPLAFLLFIYGISLFFKTAKRRNRYLITTSVILSILVYGNVVFYRFFNDFITLPVLFQTSNFGDLGNSATSSINWYDVFYFTDVVLLILAVKFLPKTKEATITKPNLRRTYFVLTFAILFLNLGLAETQRPQLLTRSFDRELLVKNIGTYNYHLYDIFIQSKFHAQRAMADGSELTDVTNYVKSNQGENNKKTFGVAKKRNVIIISLESTQNFVINNKVNGQEITPFLNKLTKDKDTFYFDNFYHQTGLGKTSDAEFIVENSLYGTGRGSVFFTNSGNTFNSMAERFNENGYFTSVLHANNKSFWNRDIVYQAFNIKKFYDVESYHVTDENSANWGLKDIPYMDQSVEIMKSMPQPFYTRMITLSNHFPFTSDEEDQLIKPYTSDDNTVNRYFQTVRYTDEAIKELFKDLKASGLYDNSIIVMYGDHYGISENHNKAMAQYLGKDAITPFDTAQLQRVPFFIHIPNSGIGKQMHEVAGQMDIRPTVLHLLGIDTKNDLQMGTDLFSKDHKDFVAFRDGRIVTDKLVYAGEVCYDKATEQKTDSSKCSPYIEQANKKLDYSDKIINGDLLRFYDNKTGEAKK
ncbi:LTA synthase family protein [Rummeliibacillus sp. TYF005]|uniref:LTA synthase family protein n=1 Tax=Rummeliibacillus sp. TYF005 TaxID=2058214 RepID=UPI000F533E16|nr:LTA synthase family protein [Rummeliibacillus sp. TYF005]RPJ94836.1 LTA synthase family protein [Rummeliibacillus sp. TYF005]